MGNFYLNGKWFEKYIDARKYADKLQEKDNIYRVVFTKAEMDSIKHEEECGK